jgi:Bacterial regulatory helix-turn-helix protein, lysR family
VGREMERDEMDERAILAGDLDLTKDIIQSIDADAQRYLNVTLSFKEDAIDRELVGADRARLRSVRVAWDRSKRDTITRQTGGRSTMIEAKQFVYFACVVTHGSFNEAAREIRVGKSTLSRVVADLEQAAIRELPRRLQDRFGGAKGTREYRGRARRHSNRSTGKMRSIT